MNLLCLLAVFALTATDDTPESRAVAYLTREVPRWATENHCYSCHNNGDAARALYAAGRLVPDRALADTTRWLAHPETWDKNAGDGAAGDKVLARIQFAAALVEALDADRVKDRKPLAQAAQRIAADQQRDGSWKVDAKGAVGSPATYGSCLATYLARRTLQRADPERHRQAIARADHWLRTERVTNVLDAAAVLLALEGSDDADARRQRRDCLDLVRKGQGSDGGWGPFVTSPSEPFDTAVVLLALIQFQDQPEFRTLLRRGRRYLLSVQQKDGSWPATTRPPGADSYAQHISTTAWATLALLRARVDSP
jgi:squalene cyclase